jgi:hypothetical protein
VRFLTLQFLLYETLVDASGMPINASAAPPRDGTVSVGYVCVLELRLQNGRHFHPRLGVSRRDALRGLAVVQPFVPSPPQTHQEKKMAGLFGDSDSDATDGTWCIDQRRAHATVVQLSSLGRRVEMLEELDGIFDPLPPSDGMGGPAVSACRLPPALFRAAAMVRVKRDLMNMTVLQLKEELEARGAPKSGALKSVLRGRLLALIITAAGAAAAEMGEESARKRPRRD